MHIQHTCRLGIVWFMAVLPIQGLSQHATQADLAFGMILDSVGEVVLLQQTERTEEVRIGQTVYLDDQLKVADHSEVILVDYQRCIEITVQGPIHLTVTTAGLQTPDTDTTPELIVYPLRHCYTPEDLRTGGDQPMGGIIFRVPP